MKLTVILLLSLVAAVWLTACDDVGGTLTVSKSFEIVDVGQKIFTLPQGTFSSTLTAAGRRLNIQINKILGESEVIQIEIPRSSTPPANGDFKFLASQTGQSFDVTGSVETRRDEGRRYRLTENCSYSVPVRVCGDRAATTASAGRSRIYSCDIKYETRFGARDVERHDTTVNVTAQAVFSDQTTGLVVARFDGSTSSNESVVDFAGPCR